MLLSVALPIPIVATKYFLEGKGTLLEVSCFPLNFSESMAGLYTYNRPH